MELSSNMAHVINTVNMKLSALDIKRMTNIQATTLMAVMRDRIHVQGRDSNGAPIGVYTPRYIKYTRNSAKYKRGTDSKVILSLSRQMEDSYIPVELDNGTGIGFSTHEDFLKAGWCEDTYKKPIFKPTAEEKEMVNQIAEKYIAKYL